MDKDQSLVYDAEHRFVRLMNDAANFPMVEAFGSSVIIPTTQIRFSSVEHIQTYCDYVVDRYEFPKHVAVRARKGNSAAHYEAMTHTIAIPMDEAWATTEVVVLHELAHHFTHGHAHDVHFRIAYLDLLRTVFDPAAALILASLYADLDLAVSTAIRKDQSA
jgi:putative metallohydrolase (TIGR04338 family)